MPPVNPSSPPSLWFRDLSSMLPNCMLCAPQLEHTAHQAVHVCSPLFLPTRLGAVTSRTFDLYLLSVFCLPNTNSFWALFSACSSTLFYPEACLIWSAPCSHALCLPVWFQWGEGETGRRREKGGKGKKGRSGHIPMALSPRSCLKMDVPLLVSLKGIFLQDSLSWVSVTVFPFPSGLDAITATLLFLA